MFPAKPSCSARALVLLAHTLHLGIALAAAPALHRDVEPDASIAGAGDAGPAPELEMLVGETRVFPTPGVTRIAVGNGAVVTADALDGKEVVLFGDAVGSSSLFIWNADGHHERLTIQVLPGDTQRVAHEVATFLSSIPQAHASVVGANVIVEGEGLSESDLAKVAVLAKRYPQIVDFTNRVGWERMVSMDVKVIEFPVSHLRDVGLNWSAVGGGAIGAIWSPIHAGHSSAYQIAVQPGGANAPPVTTPDGSTARAPSGLSLLSTVDLGLNAQLELLEQDGHAALLAEPQLSTRSGSKASFVAGGEIPYAVSSLTGSQVVFKQYGIKLDITPQVAPSGVIRASIHAEVSGIDPSVSTAAGPALLERATDTEFNVHAGETIVLSGLLQHEVHQDIDKVPFLGDLPVLGALFRSKSFQDKQTELVFFITPRLLEARSADMAEQVRGTEERLEREQQETR